MDKHNIYPEDLISGSMILEDEKHQVCDDTNDYKDNHKVYKELWMCQIEFFGYCYGKKLT